LNNTSHIKKFQPGSKIQKILRSGSDIEQYITYQKIPTRIKNS